MKILWKLAEKSTAQFWSALKWERVLKKWTSWAGTSLERDMIISENVIVGQGVSSVTVAKHYGVVEFHDKYYNKWFVPKVPSNKWKKDSKFKLKYCMQEINAVQGYGYFDLRVTFYKKDM